MGRRGMITEYKHLFNKWWSDLWAILTKYKKLWLDEVTAEMN